MWWCGIGIKVDTKWAAESSPSWGVSSLAIASVTPVAYLVYLVLDEDMVTATDAGAMSIAWCGEARMR